MHALHTTAMGHGMQVLHTRTLSALMFNSREVAWFLSTIALLPFDGRSQILCIGTPLTDVLLQPMQVATGPASSQAAPVLPPPLVPTRST